MRYSCIIGVNQISCVKLIMRKIECGFLKTLLGLNWF